MEAVLAGGTSGLFALVGHLVETQAYTVIFEPRVATGIWRILFAHTIRHSIAFCKSSPG